MLLQSPNVRKFHAPHYGITSGLRHTSTEIRFQEMGTAWNQTGESKRLIWKFVTLIRSLKEIEG